MLTYKADMSNMFETKFPMGSAYLLLEIASRNDYCGTAALVGTEQNGSYFAASTVVTYDRVQAI